MNIKVEKRGGSWVVVFGFGMQSLALESHNDTKQEAQWVAKMLRICSGNYEKSIEAMYLEKPNESLRSAHEVAKSAGTNWSTFRKMLMK